MTEKDLRTGDVVLQRDGNIGMYIEKNDDGFIVYQSTGYDFIDQFNDGDLTDASGESEFDIMQVYREDDGVLDFLYYEDGELIFERDAAWTRPSAEEMADRERRLHDKGETEQKVDTERIAKNCKKLISVIAQGFYGNRTETQIERSKVKSFLRGYLSSELPCEESQVEISSVKVPESENIVIVYDLNQEREYMEVKFPEQFKKYGAEYFADTRKEMIPHITCEIAELGFKIHTRCFACRIDETGELQGLENDDGEKFINYFPITKDIKNWHKTSI